MKDIKSTKSKRSRRTAKPASRSAPIDYNAWQVPEALHPLRDWLAPRGLDVGSLKSARQTLMMTVKLSGLYIEWPKRGEEFPVLLQLQRQLTGTPLRQPNPAARLKHTTKLGTFGSASEVRQVDPTKFASMDPRSTASKKPGKG